MVKAKVDVLRVEVCCEKCKRKILCDGNSQVECPCGASIKVESFVRITTKEVHVPATTDR